MREDFIADPDPFDDSPVAWEMCRGTQEAVRSGVAGGIWLQHGSADPSTVVCLEESRAWAGNVMLRARFSYSGKQGGPWLYFHHTGDGFYSAGVQCWPAGEKVVFVERLEGNGTARQMLAPLDFSPLNAQDFYVEARVTGARIEIRAWPAASRRPAESQASLEDGLYRSGSLGFGYDGDGALRVVSFEVEELEVKE